jgi:predicted RNase H-like HicB family nuclease
MYPVKLFYSEEDKGFIATIPDLPGCSAFGDTEEDALREVKIAQELWLETAQSENRHIPRPSSEITYSGKILLRTPKSLHQTLMERAKEEGVSLNQFLLYLLSQNIQARQ